MAGGDVRLLEGDCLAILPTLEAGSVDAVITDPPYGLDFPYHGYKDTRDNLRRLIAESMPHLRRVATRVYVLPGITQIGLYPDPDWVMAVTWNTTGSHGAYGFTQWMPVLCYGPDVKGFARLANGVMKTDTLRISGGSGVGFMRGGEEKKHTCPKPLNLMRLLVRRLTVAGETILDPFAGSGTTLIAAAQEDRQAIGIEREPTYCDIIRRRLASPEPLFAAGGT
jgi:DNA modification methylase